MGETVLFDYWRSSASYRVRIALNLAGIPYRSQPIDLVKGEHKSPEHLARNPQGFVPVLDIDGHRLTQSLAMIEYLDASLDLGFLPGDPATRAKVQALAYSIAVDMHPVCNLQVATYAAQLTDGKSGVLEAWMARFIRPGLQAFETLLGGFEQSPYCCGAKPGLADICLMPQLYNATRWGVGYADLPHIVAVQAACTDNPAFAAAYPDAVKPSN